MSFLTQQINHRAWSQGGRRSKRQPQDGSQVLTAGWEDKSAKLWDVRPRRSVRRELQHGTVVAAAEFDAGGSAAITATAGALFTAPAINS